jgi:hypothetical protein
MFLAAYIKGIILPQIFAPRHHPISKFLTHSHHQPAPVAPESIPTSWPLQLVTVTSGRMVRVVLISSFCLGLALGGAAYLFGGAPLMILGMTFFLLAALGLASISLNKLQSIWDSDSGE